ncbi:MULTISPECIES: flagellin [unclassified Methylophaga]|jgi:flagellin|uniref:flagellin N-terminal helical domain-containing protein n=1 Tax=unclassified Methylophaga TaxID=2629249 RepID=UPI000C8B7DCE|nr:MULTISPECIES: flagellin [unclassified Methylophaga]MAK67427.1 flagellin FliC [Methylophaga sp.]MAY16967.1 flagellin FliC [Methylophaga sp.]HCD05261.1 flagellin FliC [Methylophaga sp.]|tara:strand:- start:37899 stop:38732 length:834 start_codon:yes stop_codon:yes gene_type:complete
MAVIVNSNLASLNAQRNLESSQSSLNQSLQRLSSGLRINSAKDDAAGLFIAEQLTRDIRGTNQAVRNASDGISLGQTAEGALGEIGNNLQRIRELAVQSANATTGNRTGIQAEVDQLTQEISRIIQTTEFAGNGLLSAVNSLTFQVGASGAASNQLSISTVSMTGIAGYSADLAATGTIDVSTAGAASGALANLSTALDTVNQSRATYGALQNRFEAVISNLQNYAENLTAARSRIQDADFAAETANLTRAQILQQAGVSILAQANTLPQTALSLLG